MKSYRRDKQKTLRQQQFLTNRNTATEFVRGIDDVRRTLNVQKTHFSTTNRKEIDDGIENNVAMTLRIEERDMHKTSAQFICV